MAQLRQEYSKFATRDAEILVVSPESAPTLSQYWQQEQIPFIGLPDPTHRVANLYGQEVKLLKFGRLPALILIDKQGQIRYKHYGTSMRDIVANEEILTLLDKWNQEENE